MLYWCNEVKWIWMMKYVKCELSCMRNEVWNVNYEWWNMLYVKCNEVWNVNYEWWNMLYVKCNEVWNMNYEWWNKCEM